MTGVQTCALPICVIQISVTNLTIICVMIVLFILALVVPFPTHDDESGEQGPR